MWSTLEKTNVNGPYPSVGVEFGGESPDSLAGGHPTRAPLPASA